MTCLRSEIAIKGHIEQLTYYKEENGFAIARFRVEKTENSITVLGFLPEPVIGEGITLLGFWETHPIYGQQFRISSFEIIFPETIEEIHQYLISGVVRGIGPKMAEKMIQCFGDQTLQIIENEPEKLRQIDGIGSAKASLICQSWRGHQSMRSLMNLIQKAGIHASYGPKIYRKYGPDALSCIRMDPYRLIVDFPRDGFTLADAIVRALDAAVDEGKRVHACMLHRLYKAADEGHCCVAEDQLIEHCESRFSIDRNISKKALELLACRHEIFIDSNTDPGASRRIYLKALHEAEIGIVNRVAALLSLPDSGFPPEQDWIEGEIFKSLTIRLSAEQMDVIKGVLVHRMAIITGGPGTGKTTLIRAVNTILECMGKRVALAAPTGRAARRLSEVTGRKTSTLHKLLGYSLTEGRFEKNRDNPLDFDVLIVDEASMVDLFLMYHLMNAVPLTSAVILVGDVFQLPSVGPGTVLSDLIESRRLATYELKKIFRQAEESSIVVHAHRVCNGDPSDLSMTDELTGFSEFCFIERHRSRDVVNTIVRLCSQDIPSHFGFDPISHIQVLTPMHKGDLGTLNLNQALQKALNKNCAPSFGNDSGFYPGDKVIHLRNNYQKEVFNGDIGLIAGIDKRTRRILVDYEGRGVEYEFSEREELMLAYAISVHKSQGSEYPAVVVPLVMQHAILLQRNLLYTAITRGRNLVVLVGTPRALLFALQNNPPCHRHSMLRRRLSSL